MCARVAPPLRADDAAPADAAASVIRRSASIRERGLASARTEPMATSINRADVQRLVATGAQLVETLPEQDYRDGHLPGAISVPLKQLTAGRAVELDRGRPVIVYCWDSL
jgi:3-mercaptopyruvate sulfurtransferase SseA